PAPCTPTRPIARGRWRTGCRSATTASSTGSPKPGRSSAPARARGSLDSAGTVRKTRGEQCGAFSSRGCRGGAPARNRCCSHGGEADMRLRMPFGRKPNEFPSHLWTQCPSCNEMLFNKQLARNLNVCTKCDHHFRLGARERIELLVDKGSFHEHDAALTSGDPLGFTDSKPYPERIAAAQTK